MKLFLYTIVLILLLSNKGLYAQNSNITIEHYPSKKYLTQSAPISIEQDDFGFIWIGTYNGLSRFDGINSSMFYHTYNDSTSLIHNRIDCILKNKENNILIGTPLGISMYITKKEMFKSSHTAIFNKKIYPLNNILDIKQINKNHYLLATSNGLLVCKIIYENQILKTNIIDRFLTGNVIECLSELRENFVIIGSNSGLYKYNILTNEIDKINDNIKNISCITTNEKYVFTGTQNGLSINHINDLSSYKESNSDSIRALIGELNITSIKYNNFDLWIGTNSGVYKWNLKTNSLIHFSSENPINQMLISNFVRSIFIDNTDIVWIGTVGGVNQIIERKNKFRKYTTRNLTNDSIETFAGDIIWAIHKDEKKHLWISSQNKGLFKYKIEGHKHVLLDKITKKDGLNSNEIYWIYEKNEKLYLAVANKIQCININTNKIEKTVFKTNKNTFFYQFREFEKHYPGFYWCATNNGIFLLNNNFKIVENIRFGLNQTDNKIFSLQCDNKGIIWVGTENGLKKIIINSIDSNKLNAEIIQPNKKNAIFLQNIPIHSILKLQSDDMVLTTSGGFVVFNQKNNEFKLYNKQNLLPEEYLYNALEDDNKNIWFSSNNGLIRFNPNKNKFYTYTTEDGLQADEFNIGACYKDNNGELYFGGINGYNVFDPNSIKNDSIPPNIVITKFNIHYQEVIPGQKIDGTIILKNAIQFTNEIELKYDQSFFSFEFTALYYNQPDKNLFSYKLKNFNNEWSKPDTRNYVSFTNVPPGEYIFKLKAINKEGISSKNIHQIKISIKPPFWKTTLFYIVTVITVILIIYLVFKFRERKFKNEKQKLNKLVTERTQEIELAQGELKQSINFIESIIANANDGICVVNINDELILYNKSFTRILGYEHDKFSSEAFNNEVDKIWYEKVKNNIEKQKSGLKNSFEVQIKQKNKTYIYLSINYAPIETILHEKATVIILRDISVQKEQQKELDLYRDQLEDIIEKRTKELVKATKAAQNANRLKTLFLENISHEIRTPLNAIIGLSELLIDNETGNIKEKQEFTQLLNENTQYLLVLIEDIIEISKYESETLQANTKHINLQSFLLQIHSNYNNIIQNRNPKHLKLTLNCNISENIFIKIDEAKFNQLISKLFDNALKFTEKGEIEIGTKQKNNKIKIYIKDTGIGIPKNEIKAVFTPFYKVNYQDKLYRGIGIGLSIAQHIAKLHNTIIEIDSDENKGSVFSIKIPYIIKKENIVPKNLLINPTLNYKKMILIVEDEDSNYILLNEIIKRNNFKTIRAINGQEAVEIVKNNNDIAIIFMDIKMPELDGYEATKIIKKMKPKLPIIAQTAHALSDDKDKALNAGCDYYITKPFNKEKIKTILDIYVNQKQ